MGKLAWNIILQSIIKPLYAHQYHQAVTKHRHTCDHDTLTCKQQRYIILLEIWNVTLFMAMKLCNFYHSSCNANFCTLLGTVTYLKSCHCLLPTVITICPFAIVGAWYHLSSWNSSLSVMIKHLWSQPSFMIESIYLYFLNYHDNIVSNLYNTAENNRFISDICREIYNSATS